MDVGVGCAKWRWAVLIVAFFFSKAYNQEGGGMYPGKQKQLRPENFMKEYLNHYVPLERVILLRRIIIFVGSM